MTVLDRGRSPSQAVKAHIRALNKDAGEGEFLTMMIPELLKRRGIVEILRRPAVHRLKASLLAERGVQVLNIPILEDTVDPSRDESQEPAVNHVLVLVSGVHNATLQAIEYAETLRPSDLTALSFGLDPAESENLGDRWLEERIQVPLEIQDSPFRDIGASLTSYIRGFKADGVNRVVTVIIPEFVVTNPAHQFLHGQTALLVKRHLLFERGVVVASVPYHLED